MKNEKLHIWLGLATISFIWGSTWLAIKVGLESVPPFLGVGLRFIIAGLILVVIVRVRNITIPLDRNAVMLYAILVFLSYAIPFGLVYWAEQHIPSGLASILFAGFPFWVGIFSHLSLPGERMTVFKLAGIVLGFAGLFIIFFEDIHWTDSYGLLGMIAILICTVLQALCTVIVKKHGQTMNPFAMNLVGMSGGGLLLFGLGISVESFGDIRWDAAAIGSILYLAAFGSVVAFVTYYWLLKRIEAVYLSLTTFINPIIAVILGAVILSEELAPAVLLGAGFVLAGILVANGKYFYEKILAKR